MKNLENRRDFLRRSTAAVAGLGFLMVAGKTPSAAMTNATPNGCNGNGGCFNSCKGDCHNSCGVSCGKLNMEI